MSCLLRVSLTIAQVPHSGQFKAPTNEDTSKRLQSRLRRSRNKSGRGWQSLPLGNPLQRCSQTGCVGKLGGYFSYLSLMYQFWPNFHPIGIKQFLAFSNAASLKHHCQNNQFVSGNPVLFTPARNTCWVDPAQLCRRICATKGIYEFVMCHAAMLRRHNFNVNKRIAN